MASWTVLNPTPCSARPDGQHARPRPRREDDHVVPGRDPTAVGQADPRGPLFVVDAFDLADHDLTVAEHPAERDDDGTRIVPDATSEGTAGTA